MLKRFFAWIGRLMRRRNFIASTRTVVAVSPPPPPPAPPPPPPPPPLLLGTLAMAVSTFTMTTGTSSSGTITGATALSTITASGLPTGLTIDGAARTWAWDGTGSVGSGSITLTETLLGYSNSPKVNVLGYAIVAPGTLSPPVLSNPTSTGQWDTAIDATVFSGMTLHLLWFTDAGLTTLGQHLVKQITVDDLATSSELWSITSTEPPRDSTTGVLTALNMGVGDRWLYEYVELDDGTVSAHSNTLHFTLVDPNATTLWRLQPTAAPSNGGPWFAIQEVTFYQTVGTPASAVVPTSATGTAVAWNPTHTSDHLFDGNPATDFYGDDWHNPMDFTFPSAVGINQINVSSNSADPSGCIGSFDWKRWNGSAFVTLFSGNFTSGGAWGGSQTRSAHV